MVVVDSFSRSYRKLFQEGIRHGRAEYVSKQWVRSFCSVNAAYLSKEGPDGYRPSTQNAYPMQCKRRYGRNLWQISKFIPGRYLVSSLPVPSLMVRISSVVTCRNRRVRIRKRLHCGNVSVWYKHDEKKLLRPAHCRISSSFQDDLFYLSEKWKPAGLHFQSVPTYKPLHGIPIS